MRYSHLIIPALLVLAALGIAAGSTAAYVTHAETPLYSLYPSGNSLSEGCTATATLDPSKGSEQLIGVHEGDYDYFIGLFPTSGVIGMYKGFNSGSEQLQLWQVSAGSSPHTAVIKFSGGVVAFYVDGALRYSFKASQTSYDLLVNNVKASVTSPTPTTTSTQTSSNPGSGNSGSSNLMQNNYLLLALGAGVIFLIILIPAMKGRFP